ncbi:P-loop containing nucleoside triphosphate hydrolase protein [Boletus reticuloceps]|uniref:P-loop containing nucleoside triphosphate hydrolase protein n=1 Tax=Boletus reticuloceps TaxID=495285 RepID=A0A8I2YVP9_9AGAM|nr:P-loop containing nucleoside triphosphate hydrolase protein [Boletus reticuloceps]
MGATGSGKSTFINLASGSNLAVSDSLESCTVDVETSTFFLDGRTVTLVDTPGFDDSTRSDTDVLKSITDYLSGSYSQGARLAGVIYMHRITDNKMGGPSRRNFHIFRNLCGDATLQNVLLVTNMWSKVDPDEGEARERELANKDKFFKPALDRGARMLRHDGSQESTYAILRHLVGLEPSTLLVQDEMVNQEKDLAHTTVGANIMCDLKEQGERHAEALEDLCIGIEAARLAEDEETRQILQDEARKAREKVEQIRSDLERMVTTLQWRIRGSRMRISGIRRIPGNRRRMLITKHNCSSKNVGLVNLQRPREGELRRS